METKPTLETVLERIAEQTALIRRISEEFIGVKADVAGLKSDLAGVKEGVADLKTETAGVKFDVAGVKAGMMTLKAMLEVIDARTRRIENRINILSQDVLDMRASVQRMDVELLNLKAVS